MVRRGQQKKREQQRASRRALKELDSEQGVYRPPPRQRCSTKEFDQYVDDQATIRIVVRQWHQQGRLVDFALTLELMRITDDGVEWVAFTRVDCCHGYAHGHALVGPAVQKPPHPIQRLDTVADVPGAFSKSVAQIGYAGVRMREQEGTPWKS